jgi:exosome complex exonuclease RRP6
MLSHHLILQKPLDLDASPSAVFVDSLYELENMLAHLKAQPEFAVDLEHHSYRSFQGITCLLQVTIRFCFI